MMKGISDTWTTFSKWWSNYGKDLGVTKNLAGYIFLAGQLAELTKMGDKLAEDSEKFRRVKITKGKKA